MSQNYSGDVTIDTDREAPVAIEDPEDVFVKPDSVDDQLEIRNAEWVFTAEPVEGSVEVGPPQKRVSGDIEDGYIDDVDGDAVIDTAEDVFVAYGGVGRSIDADGVEQVFHDSSDPATPPSACDETVAGWKRSQTVRRPSTGVLLTGSKLDVTITDAPAQLTLHVVGWDNTVTLEGDDTDLTVHFVGRENRVEVGPYSDATIASESGFDNELDDDPVPHEDLIETGKSDAYSRVTIGRARVTYQTPADERRCPRCHEPSETIVERHYRDALFVFGHPLYTFEHGVSGYECTSCKRGVSQSAGFR